MRKIFVLFIVTTFFGCKSPRSEADRPVIQINKVFEQEESRIKDSLKKKNISVIKHRPILYGDSLYNF